MHDDQHGTAIISGAALINGLDVVDKKIGEITVVISGAGHLRYPVQDITFDLEWKEVEYSCVTQRAS